MVIGHPDVICIKLENGATIWPGVEEDGSAKSDKVDPVFGESIEE